MAQTGHTITTKWIEGAKRECVKCGAEIKNLDREVGVVRSRYPGPVREIICMNCHTGRNDVDTGSEGAEGP